MSDGRRARRCATRPSGLTLIEVMMVVVIIAILAAVAIPGYQEHIRRANRSEARAGLLQAAQWLERVATASGLYLKDAAAFPDSLKDVPSRTYVIGFATADEGSTYILTATPRNAQADDKCGVLTLNQAGDRGLASPDVSNDLKAECWSR
ncbi:MAG: type IV pilin protein [Variovorax sp.]